MSYDEPIDTTGYDYEQWIRFALDQPVAAEPWYYTEAMAFECDPHIVISYYTPTWDHDHWSFCWTKFAMEDYPGVLHDGYCTLDEYHWICSQCFDDFKDLFDWR